MFEKSHKWIISMKIESHMLFLRGLNKKDVFSHGFVKIMNTDLGNDVFPNALLAVG